MKYYRILQNNEDKGPYTLEQLKSMWSTGALTADAHYWTEGMEAWQSICDLCLDSALQQTIQPHVAPLPTPVTPQQNFQVHHTGRVKTKANGSEIVALGSIICVIGVLMTMGGFLINIGISILGFVVLIIGFFMAVIGRLMA